MGGAIDKTRKKTIIRRMLELCQSHKPNICLITLATSEPEEETQVHHECFRSIMPITFSHIHYTTRAEADEKKSLDKVKQADIVFFSGGDQLRLSSLLGGTELLGLLKERYYDDKCFTVAGSSAGAAAMSNTMIVAGESENSMIKGELELTNGLDFINEVFIDTHFTERGRIGRLIQMVTHNPGILGIGLGENTAAIISHGEEIEVVGSGLMVVVDGINIDYTDLAEIPEHTPITVEGIKVSAIGNGKKFSIPNRTLILEKHQEKKSNGRNANHK